uniref:Venom cystatin 2 n=1 Tax=Ectomocoris sp. TaxID=3104572 RepID=A0AB38ZED0_9HEMI
MLKITLSLCLFVLMFAAYSDASLSSEKPPLIRPGLNKVGVVKEISVDHPQLKKSLKRVIAEKNTNIKIVKIIKATRQTINGYAYNVQFLAEEGGKQKTCNANYVVLFGKILGTQKQALRIRKFECK